MLSCRLSDYIQHTHIKHTHSFTYCVYIYIHIYSYIYIYTELLHLFDPANKIVSDQYAKTHILNKALVFFEAQEVEYVLSRFMMWTPATSGHKLPQRTGTV